MSVSLRFVFVDHCSDGRFMLVEFAVLTYDEAAKQPKAKIYKPSEIDGLLKTHDLAKKDDTQMQS